MLHYIQRVWIVYVYGLNGNYIWNNPLYLSRNKYTFKPFPATSYRIVLKYAYYWYNLNSSNIRKNCTLHKIFTLEPRKYALIYTFVWRDLNLKWLFSHCSVPGARYLCVSNINISKIKHMYNLLEETAFYGINLISFDKHAI